ncbi:MAG: hypothetical protein QW594_01000 [Candidatus Woesearchaeota archaeon]
MHGNKHRSHTQGQAKTRAPRTIASNKRLNKKADVEGVIKWVFVLFAGGIILFVFLQVYNNFKETAEKEAMVDVTIKLNNILSNAQGNPNTVFTITLRDAELFYDDCKKGLYLNNNRNLRIPLQHLFAPAHLHSFTEEYFLFVMPFSYPFRSANTVFLTSPDVIYIFFINQTNPSTVIKDFFNERKGMVFPDRLTYYVFGYNYTEDRNGQVGLKTKMTQAIEQLDAENRDSAVFIMNSDDVPNNLEIRIEKKIKTPIKVKYLAKEEGKDYGYVLMANMKKTGDRFILEERQGALWFDRATMFGTIISDNAEIYNCTIATMLQRYHHQLDIYKKRCEKLYDYYEFLDSQQLPFTCKDYELYAACQDTITAIQMLIANYPQQQQSFSVADIELLYEYAFITQDLITPSLKHLSEEYAKNKECPLIY